MTFYEVIITGDGDPSLPRERVVLSGSGWNILNRTSEILDALIAAGHLPPDAIQNGNGRTEVATYDTVKVPGSLLVEILKKLEDGDFRHDHYATLDDFVASVDPAAVYSVYLSEV